ncbi:hypothetical protein NDU88_006410 [Pleurodeles waltl]|uniref:Uncharacterized protein n=1 Tax=Pleurodeles waltl TaxID=8319 RepID=A0AAV7MZ70_PLEWA|nr:hypothetical protein NDU88_006410 [Pleurodeles waltl]
MESTQTRQRDDHMRLTHVGKKARQSERRKYESLGLETERGLCSRATRPRSPAPNPPIIGAEAERPTQRGKLRSQQKGSLAKALH